MITSIKGRAKYKKIILSYKSWKIFAIISRISYRSNDHLLILEIDLRDRVIGALHNSFVAIRLDSPFRCFVFKKFSKASLSFLSSISESWLKGKIWITTRGSHYKKMELSNAKHFYRVLPFRRAFGRSNAKNRKDGIKTIIANSVARG